MERGGGERVSLSFGWRWEKKKKEERQIHTPMLRRAETSSRGVSPFLSSPIAWRDFCLRRHVSRRRYTRHWLGCVVVAASHAHVLSALCSVHLCCIYISCHLKKDVLAIFRSRRFFLYFSGATTYPRKRLILLSGGRETMGIRSTFRIRIGSSPPVSWRARFGNFRLWLLS